MQPQGDIEISGAGVRNRDQALGARTKQRKFSV
jgi:hypothetical protein